MEEEMELTCKECGAEVIRPYKEPPKNAREGKQSFFHCKNCGAVNLRDGTVRDRKEYTAQEKPQEKEADEPNNNNILRDIALVGLAAIGTIFGIKAFNQYRQRKGNS